MAQPDIEVFTARGLAVIAEVTEGTDPGVTSAADAYQILDGKSGTEFDKIERKLDKAFFSGDEFVVANNRAFIEGTIELTPPAVPGTDPASCARILLPCGMAEDLDDVARITSYAPISRAIPTVTAAWWHGGTFRTVTGARGNLTGLTLKIGDRFMAQLRLQGDYEEIEEDDLPTDFDYSAFLTPTVVTDENSRMLVSVVDGSPTNLHLWGKELSLDFGNQLQSKQFTELRVNRISDRKGTYKATFVRTAKADFDPWALRAAGELVTFEFRLMEDDGRTSTLSVRGQIEGINEVDVDGDYLWEITGPCIASDDGGDEFGLAFGNLAPINSVLPAITGTPEVGQTLTVGTGTWVGSIDSYAYQWYADGVAIGGATASTHVVGSGDFGKLISATVAATQGDGTTTVTATGTVGIRPINSVLPVITGTPNEGEVLSATTGTWSGTGLSYGFVWKLDGVAITGPAETADTYLVRTGDEGSDVTVTVTATKNSGSASATSTATTIVP